MDLLLQTQGWREFLWRRVRDASVVVKYMPEPGVTISGKVRRALSDKGVGSMNITLFAAGSSGNKIFSTQTDRLGRYFLDSLPLTGWQTVKLTVRNKKNEKEGVILLDSVLAKTWPVKTIPNVIYDTSDIVTNFRQTAAQRKNRMLRQAQEAADKSDLGNVTVKANPFRKERLQEGGMGFGKADSLFTITPADKEYRTLGYYILQRYPFAYSDANSDGFYFIANGKRVAPRWIVDGREDLFSTGSPFTIDAETGLNEGAFDRVDYFSILIDKVKQIYIRPTVTSTGSMVYVVHLSLLPGAMETSDLTQIITQINGYYEARKYYVPNFTSPAGNSAQTDLRSTIFWAPDTRTDAAGKATITFKNSDAKTSVRVAVEGITDQGVPIAATVKYEVK